MHCCLCQFLHQFLSDVGRCVSFWVRFSLVLTLCQFFLSGVGLSASVSGSVSPWCWMLCVCFWVFFWCWTLCISFWVSFSLDALGLFFSGVGLSASVSLGLSFSMSVSVSLYHCLTSPTHRPQSIHRKPQN